MKRETIVIGGALANKPWNGGNAWTRMSWVLGFQRLGFDVCFVEQIRRSDCVDERGVVTPFENSVNREFFRTTIEQFGLSGSSALICEDGEQVYGMPLAALSSRVAHASLLFNISGHIKHSEVTGPAQCTVYYDDDPGFTQFWHAADGSGSRLGDHDYYFTIGSNIGAPDCVIPTDGIRWRHTRPPVLLADWPVCRQTNFDRFTTVASWRGAYGPVQFAGRSYGLKAHEFRKFIDLPRQSGRSFEIALQIHPADKNDLSALLAHDWRIADPLPAAGSADAFRKYVQTSGAEFSVAQGIYVDTNSGWVSDRTVRYLASGKPALVQDTGLAGHYPIGEGLLTFRTLDEAIDGAERILVDYPKHCRAARRLAEQYFDSDTVIRRLAAEIGLRVSVATRRPAEPSPMLESPFV